MALSRYPQSRGQISWRCGDRLVRSAEYIGLKAAGSQASGAADVHGTSEYPGKLDQSSCSYNGHDEMVGSVASVEVGAVLQRRGRR